MVEAVDDDDAGGDGSDGGLQKMLAGLRDTKSKLQGLSVGQDVMAPIDAKIDEISQRLAASKPQKPHWQVLQKAAAELKKTRKQLGDARSQRDALRIELTRLQQKLAETEVDCTNLEEQETRLAKECEQGRLDLKGGSGGVADNLPALLGIDVDNIAGGPEAKNLWLTIRDAAVELQKYVAAPCVELQQAATPAGTPALSQAALAARLREHQAEAKRQEDLLQHSQQGLGAAAAKGVEEKEDFAAEGVDDITMELDAEKFAEAVRKRLGPEVEIKDDQLTALREELETSAKKKLRV